MSCHFRLVPPWGTPRPSLLLEREDLELIRDALDIIDPDDDRTAARKRRLWAAFHSELETST